MNLEVINAWTEDEARQSVRAMLWIEAMVPSDGASARPFDSAAAVIATGERIWWGLSQADWLEAFAAHPRIGDVDAIRSRFATTAAWASREQSGALGASEEVLQALARKPPV